MLSVIIDWLEFTVLEANLKFVFQLLGLNFASFTPLSKGRFGYHNQLKWQDGSIFIMFTTPDKEITENSQTKSETGIHVMITGQGCRHYSVNHDLLALIGKLYSMDHINFSRIDLAIDDYESKIINYGRINQAALAGYFTSRWSKWDEINSRQTATGEFLGRTMYFGSQASDLFCRIYDKSLERKANTKQVFDNAPKNWTRLELVYRKDRAKKLVEHLIDGHKSLGHVLRGTLRQYLRFVTPATDQNKARWPSASWWDQLLADVEKLQLTIKKESASIEQMTAWVDRQVAPTMAAILKAYEGDMTWLRKTIVAGGSRLTQKHNDAVSLFKKEVPV
ncbi:replication initiation factor domain-containing protein [Lactobacillus sp. ESL0791]|uniref:replication initiation factor domain-containing protein n=1 Tax=Lactobacillus sp. ESL0791 TaxID=2983234 RepID=UPI0023F898FC|nr:replication initiation factor domain-containing protein [Lactobacillus sp. ESL0791]MDF7639982.1 replication initiation factor domain-containing protein [Lactobacillus sp. ESL0791]